MIYIFIVITSAYIVLITILIFGFDRVKVYQQTSNSLKLKFSIIIPFRNEEKHLSQLLESILQLKYSSDHFEVLLIDDDSHDKSVEIIKTFKLKNDFQNLSIIKTNRHSQAPKKDAIVTGITHAKYDWIITTDADCIVPQLWLKTLDDFIQNGHPKMIIAPVTYHNSNSFLKGFQLMDFFSLQGTAIGSYGIGMPFLCNGANFAYSKQFFNDLNGFKGNENIASGDDIFLLDKGISKDKNSVYFIKSKDVIVRTQAQPDFVKLVQQRVRWTKKMTSIKTASGKVIGIIVFLMNLTLLVLLFLSLIGLFDHIILLIGFIFKIIIDLVIIYRSAKLTGQLRQLFHYLPSSICYPFFSVFIVIYSLFSNYNWKGRAYFK